MNFKKETSLNKTKKKKKNMTNDFIIFVLQCWNPWPHEVDGPHQMLAHSVWLLRAHSELWKVKNVQ